MLMRVILTFYTLNQVNCINKGIFREKKIIYIYLKKILIFRDILFERAS